MPPLDLIASLLNEGHGNKLEEVSFSPNLDISQNLNRPDTLLVLTEGIAKVEVSRKNSWEFETLIAVGAVFGIEHCFSNRKYEDTANYRAIALTDGQAFEIQKYFFLQYMYTHPALFHFIIEELIVRYKFLTFNYQEKKSPLKQRVIDLLMEFIILTRQDLKQQYVTLPLFDENMVANPLKCSTHHIENIFKRLSKQKLILKSDETGIVLDCERLKKLSTFS
ncbi:MULTISPECIES: Crp/Fnr family transcriptional regulator [Listeria]|uniref:Crp/Fnr family transcriptional regulator n=1 Tax=Listeria TaxID=1637 RepID=UPI000B58CCB6|nr:MULTISPECIES: Crp/Fnr family transcriptional regulator [Listeria]